MNARTTVRVNDLWRPGVAEHEYRSAAHVGSLAGLHQLVGLAPAKMVMSPAGRKDTSAVKLFDFDAIENVN